MSKREILHSPSMRAAWDAAEIFERWLNDEELDAVDRHNIREIIFAKNRFDAGHKFKYGE